MGRSWRASSSGGFTLVALGWGAGPGSLHFSKRHPGVLQKWQAACFPRRTQPRPVLLSCRRGQKGLRRDKRLRH